MRLPVKIPGTAEAVAILVASRTGSGIATDRQL